MENIIDFETDSEKYQEIKKSLRLLYQKKIQPRELILLVYLMENDVEGKSWGEIHKELKGLSKSTFYRAVSDLIKRGIVTDSTYQRYKPNETSEKQTYLAFDGRYYKIGKSKNPQARIESFKTANPNVQLIYVCRRDIEKQLHQEYQKFRRMGEWFELEQDQAADIISKMRVKNQTS